MKFSKGEREEKGQQRKENRGMRKWRKKNVSKIRNRLEGKGIENGTPGIKENGDCISMEGREELIKCSETEGGKEKKNKARNKEQMGFSKDKGGEE